MRCQGVVLSQLVEPYNDSVFWNASVSYTIYEVYFFFPPSYSPSCILIIWQLNFNSLNCHKAIFFYIPWAGSVLRQLDRAQNTRIKSTRITYIDLNIIHKSTMPSNYTSNNIDFVLPTQYLILPTRKAKEPPSQPQLLPLLQAFAYREFLQP